MNNEIRNILLYLDTLKKEINKNKIEENNKKEIDFYYNQILERIKFLIEDDKEDYNRKLEKLNYNNKLLDAIKKGEL